MDTHALGERRVGGLDEVDAGVVSFVVDILQFSKDGVAVLTLLVVCGTDGARLTRLVCAGIRHQQSIAFSA